MNRITFTLLSVSVAMLGACSSPGKSYESPSAASAALVDALSPIDMAKVRTVLGSDGVKLLDSGDAEADQATVKPFLDAFQTQHELVEADDTTVMLEVGSDNWQLPIPLVKSGAGWRFDTEAGFEEIMARRIGRNELDAIQACLAIVDAEREYSSFGYGGAPGVYAERFVSTPGMRDGLVFPTAESEHPSPLGPFIAAASPARAAAVQQGAVAPKEPRPYHGYTFRILRSQGAHAPGGAMDYVVDGRMSKGFAVIAAPAVYDETGVMTFMVSHLGVIFEHDLGSRTVSKARAMNAFDPTPEWTIVPHDWE